MEKTKINQDNSHTGDGKTLPSYLTWKGAAVACCILFVILILLNYLNFLKLYSFVPGLSFLPHKSFHWSFSKGFPTLIVTSDIPKTALEICSVRAKDYALVYDVSRVGPIITGQYRGTIESIKYVGSAITMNIISDNASETHTFILSALLPFYDAVHAKKIQLSDLKKGDYLGVNFNCDSSSGDQFQIISAGIEQK